MKNLDLNSARNYILYCLSIKMYTKKELSDKLKKKNYSDEIISEALNSLEENGIINDYDYAFAYLHDNLNIKAKGLFRIKQELYLKGISREVVETVISENTADTLAPLMDYVRLRYGEDCTMPQKEFEKAKAHLIRRGFSASEIRQCFENLSIKANWSEEF